MTACRPDPKNGERGGEGHTPGELASRLLRLLCLDNCRDNDRPMAPLHTNLWVKTTGTDLDAEIKVKRTLALRARESTVRDLPSELSIAFS